MRPILAQIGPFNVYSYGLMLALGLTVAYLAIRPRARAIGLHDDRLLNLFALTLLAGVAGARITFLILSGGRWVELFQFGHGGLSFFGGLAFGLAVFALMLRRWRLPFLDLADAVAPGLALGEAVTRLGCDIFGKPTAAWWGLRHEGLIVHPVQLYAYGLNFLIYLCLITFRPNRAGRTGALYLILLGAARFLVEFFRTDAAVIGPFTWGHGAAALTALAGLAVYVFGVRRKAAIVGARLRAWDFASLGLVPMFFLFR